MRRVLVLGGSFSAIEMIKCAKGLGFYVIVCSGDQNEPGHSISNESVYLDYSDIKAVCEYVSSNPIDFVIPTSNDAAYRTGLELNQNFNFPGFDSLETGLKFLEKNKFRDLCHELGLAAPNFRISDEASLVRVQSEFQFPFLVKPIDGFSGKGIIKIVNADERVEMEALDWSENSQKCYVIEEFLEGTLHSHSAFIKSGGIINDFFVDEFCMLNEFAVDSSNHPSHLGQLVKHQVREMILRALEHLDLVDGLIHTQFIVSNGKPFLIESMRRCPGDLYPNLINLSTGFDYIYNYVAPFLQVPVQDSGSFKNEDLPIARFTIASKQATNANAINVPWACLGFRFYPLLKSGEHLDPFPEAKVGVLFAQLPTLEALFSLVPNAQQQIGVLD
jgi:phosphoribosylaminoimidazole carboxylase (NCAIR synthetase)